MGKKSQQQGAAQTAVDVDIYTLRDEFESDTEWKLRKKFLEANADSLELDRLICLSRCFVNMVIYECKYPNAVMIEIQQRGMGIVDDIEDQRKADAKQAYHSSFVKAARH